MASKTSPFAAPAVGTTTRVPPGELRTFHKNPRRGDTALIANSLRTHGQYKPICANVGTHTGRPNEVLAGNHTLMAFRDIAESTDDPYWQSILVHWVDVDDDTADRIVAVDNRASEVGSNDTEALVSLLSGVSTLDGTGYTADSLADLVAIVENRTVDDLDGIADEYGTDPDTATTDKTLILTVPPNVSAAWRDHRDSYDNDGDALFAALAAIGT